MSDANAPSLLPPDVLTALGAAGDPETIGGIAAIQARLIYEIGSFVSLFTNHLGALAGSQPDGTTQGVSFHPNSITAMGSAVGSGISQVFKPQIDALVEKIGGLENQQKVLTGRADNLDAEHAKTNGALGVLGNQVEHLGNVHNSLHSKLNEIDEHVQRLQRDEIMAEISQGIRGELVALITAEWSERFQQLEAQHAALGSRFEELERAVRQRAEPEQHGSVEPPASRTRR
jgi:DNA repair exonuclease SbcCD ATPase subunit